MTDIIFKDLEGWQARALIKLVDMMKASEEKINDMVRETVNGETKWTKIGTKPRHPETFQNVGKIEEIINNDPLY